MAGKDREVLLGGGLPGPGQTPELALLSTAAPAGAAVAAAEIEEAIKRLLGASPASYGYRRSTPCSSVVGWCETLRRCGGRCAAGLAADQPEADSEAWAAARGPRAGGRAESAVGLGDNHGHPGLGWIDGAPGGHDRLRGPDGTGLALRQAHDRRGPRRDAAGGHVPAVRRSTDQRAGSSSLATMGRSTPRIGSARSYGPRGCSPATCPDGARSRTAWRRGFSGASNETTCTRQA